MIQLKIADALLQANLSLTSEHILSLDQYGTIIYVNSPAASLFGAADNNGLGLDFFTCFEARHKQAAIDWFNELATHNGKSSRAFSMIFPGEAPRTLKLTFSSVKDDHHRLIGFSGIIERFSEAEIKLREESEKSFFELILHNIPADIAVFDNRQRYLFLNKQAIQDDEFRAFMIGKDDFDYCTLRNKPIDIAKQRRAEFDKMLITGEPYFFEEKMPNGNDVGYHLRIMYPLKNKEGKIDKVIGYGMNITQLKKSQLLNQQLTQSVDATMDGVALLDENRVYTYMNSAHAHIFGYSKPEDLLGKTWKAIYNKEWQEKIEKEHFPVLMQSGSWKGTTIGVSASGQEVMQEISLAIIDSNKIICICRDITASYHQKQQMEELALVVEKTGSVIILTDELGRILWVNNGFTKVTEFAMEEVVGKYASEILCGPETDVETMEAIRRSVNEKSKYSGEILNYTKSGKKFWIYIDITPIYNDAGEVVKFIAVENDITAIKEAEKKLMDNLEQERKLSELKSRFVTLTSHEFRTPLGSIQTSKDIIQLILKHEHVAISDQLDQQFKRIDSQIERISRVMNNILVLGRIDAGRISFKPKLGSLEGLISNVLEEEYMHFQTNTVKPLFVVKGAPRELRMDFELMDFILRNLISNGFKYGDPTKPLTVSIYYEDSFVQIEVIDKGIGIPEEDQPFIFQSFFRAKNAEHITGTGLGLILVKQFVEMHKGTIDFKTMLSQGATFKIMLPYNEEN